VAGSCERRNEPSGFIKGGEFLDQLSDQVLCSFDGVGLYYTYCSTVIMARSASRFLEWQYQVCVLETTVN
jgi:hypothetical protein